MHSPCADTQACEPNAKQRCALRRWCASVHSISCLQAGLQRTHRGSCVAGGQHRAPARCHHGSEPFLRRCRVLPLLRARGRISSTPRERTTLSEEGRRNVGASELPSAPLTAVIAATAPARGPGSGHSQRMGVQGMRGAASHLRDGARNREARLAWADEHPSSLRARASPRRVKRDLGQALAAPQRGAAAVSGRYQADYGGMLLSSAAHEKIRIVQPARLHNGCTRYPLSRRGFLAAQRCVHLLCSTLRAGHCHLHQRHISIGVLRDRERTSLSVLGFAPAASTHSLAPSGFAGRLAVRRGFARGRTRSRGKTPPEKRS